MAKKKKAPEHENLERWLVSYADFITLLFATFVVLYALAQTDVSELSKIDEALQKAFSRNSIMQGQESILDSSPNIFDSQNGNSFIQELMTEYISQKYESQSFEQIEKTIEKMKKDGELEGVEAKMTDQGLMITFEEHHLFRSGSAELSINAQKLVDKVGVLIFEKFILHCIRVEGHTDSSPIASTKFPSNWELSSARACTIVRYLIQRFQFMPSLFTAVGYADTRPADGEKKEMNSSKNRRVEILILKKQFSAIEKPQNEILKMSKEKQLEFQTKRKELVSQIKAETRISPAAQALLKNNKKQVIDMKNYAKSRGITLDNKNIYNSITPIKTENDNKTFEKQIEHIEDFEL